MKLSVFGKFILNNLFAIIGLALFAYFIINFSYIHYTLLSNQSFENQNLFTAICKAKKQTVFDNPLGHKVNIKDTMDL